MYFLKFYCSLFLKPLWVLEENLCGFFRPPKVFIFYQSICIKQQLILNFLYSLSLLTSYYHVTGLKYHCDKTTLVVYLSRWGKGY